MTAKIDKAQQWLSEIDSLIDSFPRLTDEMIHHPFLLCDLGIALGALARAQRILEESIEIEKELRQ